MEFHYIPFESLLKFFHAILKNLRQLKQVAFKGWQQTSLKQVELVPPHTPFFNQGKQFNHTDCSLFVTCIQD